MEYASTLREHTIESVKLSYFAKKNAPCKERKQKYEVALNLLNKFYKDDTPLISNIHTSDLEAFSEWYDKNYIATNRHVANTKTTQFSMIAAIFIHAFKTLKILTYNPLPAGFRGSFVDAKREVLTNILMILKYQPLPIGWKVFLNI